MAMQDEPTAGESMSAQAEEWQGKAVNAYEALPVPVKGSLTLPEPPSNAAPDQLCAHWQRVHTAVEDLSQTLQQGLLLTPPQNVAPVPVPAPATPMLDLSGIPDYQQLAERIARADAAAWQAALPGQDDPTTDLLADIESMHPMLAVTNMLTTLTCNSITVSNMTKRGSRGFYLTYDTASQRIRKDKTPRSKQGMWEALASLADHRVPHDRRQYALPLDVRKALLGLQGSLRALLPADLQDAFDAQ